MPDVEGSDEIARLDEARRDVQLGCYRRYDGVECLVFALSLHRTTYEILVHYYDYQLAWTCSLEDFQSNVYGGSDPYPKDGTPMFTFIRAAMNSDILFALGMILMNLAFVGHAWERDTEPAVVGSTWLARETYDVRDESIVKCPRCGVTALMERNRDDSITVWDWTPFGPTRIVGDCDSETVRHIIRE